MSAVVKFSLSLGLLILYGLGAVIWYELLRSELGDLLARRRRRRRRRKARWDAGDEAEPEPELAGPIEHGRPDQQADQESELDPARRHYHLACEAAKAERDAAVQAATEATKQAVERIEQRYRRADSVDDTPASKADLAERDAAIDAADAATRQAVDRIERRYREIDWALEDEEAERLEALSRRR
jgi:hypothetical protein